MPRSRALSPQEERGAVEEPPPALEECLRACATHSGKLVAGLDRRRGELAEALRALLALHASRALPAGAPRAERGPVSALLRRAQATASAAPAAAPGPLTLDNALLDALLAVGGKALDCGYEDERALADVVSRCLVALRKGSRAAWRLRGRVLEAQGAYAEAADAYDEYLSRTEEDGFGVRARVAGLRVAAERERELAGLLAAARPGAGAYREEPLTETWFDGLELVARGELDGAHDRFAGALLGLADRGEWREFQDALGRTLDVSLHDLDSRVTTPGPDAPVGGGTDGGPRAALNALLAHYADLARSRQRGPVEEPTFGGTKWLSLGEFRNRIAGKSVCLVANSGRVGTGSLGAEIDAYDLVVRFNSYRIDPRATGARTDIHVTIHKHAFNWDQHVDTRLVFGGDVGAWRSSLRNRLVPGAQVHLGDDSLRWPLREIGKVGPEEWPAIPTTGFNTLFLLDFLDVNPVIDLIGFDFYESGAYRTTEAMRMPVTSVHEYADEKTWVLDRATKVTEHRISLR
ncbi:MULTISPECIES: glycosyltransferase family 29 protein [unclassified Streptomyces]|uniref:glycosyltransferase family 29 protein n=1 Tax=unclassified Streptomyces TaxID=2593676 RepID=UPI00081E54EE|nr:MULTISPECIES: glycosyltransferase family 29 protein [unclassified Streptomyces]MYR26713.1 hypothetical protein [Streptomyces sp. SID4945]SCF09204.1 hypothetical protein GA0115257_106790 [Streptomyces sp. LcepLS]